jgi:hypothetical protein
MEATKGDAITLKGYGDELTVIDVLANLRIG